MNMAERSGSTPTTSSRFRSTCQTTCHGLGPASEQHSLFCAQRSRPRLPACVRRGAPHRAGRLRDLVSEPVEAKLVVLQKLDDGTAIVALVPVGAVEPAVCDGRASTT